MKKWGVLLKIPRAHLITWEAGRATEQIELLAHAVEVFALNADVAIERARPLLVQWALDRPKDNHLKPAPHFAVLDACEEHCGPYEWVVIEQKEEAGA